MFERFTTEARQVVVAAREAARDLRADRIDPVHLQEDAGAGAAARPPSKDRRIDSSHLLFGVLAVGDPVVIRVLQRLGTDPAVLRDRTDGAGEVASSKLPGSAVGVRRR